MARTIWKFEIKPGRFSLELPARAKVLSVGLQETGPQMWVELEPDLPKANRFFVAIPTGGDVVPFGTYIGTIHGIGGWMVFHIYELMG